MGHAKRTRLLRGRYFVTLNARNDIRIKKESKYLFVPGGLTSESADNNKKILIPLTQ